MTPKAWLFDFDGVLADSQKIHRSAWHQACLDLFGSVPDLKQDEGHFGKAAPQIAALYATRLGYAERAIELLDHKNSLVIAQANMPTLPGALDLLKALSYKKIPLGVASNAPRPIVDRVLTLWGFPNRCVIGWQESPRPKPAPDPWLLCAQGLNLGHASPRDIIAFDDSAFGLQGAIEATYYSVGIADYESPLAKNLKNLGADLIIPQLACINIDALPQFCLR